MIWADNAPSSKAWPQLGPSIPLKMYYRSVSEPISTHRFCTAIAVGTLAWRFTSSGGKRVQRAEIPANAEIGTKETKEKEYQFSFSVRASSFRIANPSIPDSASTLAPAWAWEFPAGLCLTMPHAAKCSGSACCRGPPGDPLPQGGALEKMGIVRHANRVRATVLGFFREIVAAVPDSVALAMYPPFI